MTDTFPKPSRNPHSEVQREYLRELTQDEAADLLFISFYYSQGDAKLQENLFRAIARIHPEIRVPVSVTSQAFTRKELPRYVSFLKKAHTGIDEDGEQEFRAQLEELRLKAEYDNTLKVQAAYQSKLLAVENIEHLMKTLGISWHDAQIAENMEAEAFVMQECLNRHRTKKPDDKLFTEILTGMLARDAKMLLSVDAFGNVWGQRDRPSNGVERPVTGPFSPRKSHFFSYIVQGERAIGPALFQDLFKKLRESVQSKFFANSLSERRSLPRLHHLIQWYGYSLNAMPELVEKLQRFKLKRSGQNVKIK